ncbi:hypothetical protein I3843_15G017900 [Carya illinoinensis]|nr:hypothetical protein I3843_15G017900 [Carya illinoinensis]
MVFSNNSKVMVVTMALIVAIMLLSTTCSEAALANPNLGRRVLGVMRRQSQEIPTYTAVPIGGGGGYSYSPPRP